MFPKNFNEAIKTGFIPYILEAEGCNDLCNTRGAKINAIIKDFKYLVRQGKNPNDYITSTLAKYGFKEEDLTYSEIKRINGAINGAY